MGSATLNSACRFALGLAGALHTLLSLRPFLPLPFSFSFASAFTIVHHRCLALSPGELIVTCSFVWSDTRWRSHTLSAPQELLEGPILARVKADEARFSSAGREDVDVRMLGSGRPFIFELVNPRRRKLPPALLAEMEVRLRRLITQILFSCRHNQTQSLELQCHVRVCNRQLD
jgi:hypothetical protein